jgi:hypothetical protein
MTTQENWPRSRTPAEVVGGGASDPRDNEQRSAIRAKPLPFKRRDRHGKQAMRCACIVVFLFFSSLWLF